VADSFSKASKKASFTVSPVSSFDFLTSTTVFTPDYIVLYAYYFDEGGMRETSAFYSSQADLFASCTIR
jgi:hypothetical protein